MARRRPPVVHGTVLVDKPAGVTSHDVVARLRRRLGERRIGHAGTLDPSATGLLVVGVGAATRLLRYATASTKTYETEIVLGVDTSTLDADGEVVAEHDMVCTPDEVRSAAMRFVGDIDQVPPMVSAVRVEGRRLHELAREGLEVEREARRVRVDRFDVEPTPDPLVYRAVVECGPGTYVRCLGQDLGRSLGGGAHIRALRRTRSGPFSVDEAGSIDDAPLLGVREMVRAATPVELDAAEATRVGHGGVLDAARYVGDGPWALVSTGGELLAVHESGDGAPMVGVVLAQPAR